jgi:hypothetical protein
MKQFFTFLAGFFFAVNIQAQQAAAQLAFEEAETLYNELKAVKLPSNQRIDQIEKVNQKLNEVEKIVGEKPKTLYLRALANNSCFDYLNEEALYNSKTAERYFTALELSRKSAGRYLQLKQNDEVDDRYREMKKILDDLQKFPNDRKTWQKEKQAREAETAKAEKDKESRKEQFLTRIKQYDEDKDRYYREIAPKIDAWEYKEGIKIGMDFNELQQNKKEWFKGHRISATGSSLKNKYKKHEKDLFADVVVDKDNRVVCYSFQVFNSKNFFDNPITEDLDKLILSLKKYFGEDLILEKYEKLYPFYVIKSPYAINKIVIETDPNSISLTKISNSLTDSYSFKDVILAGESAVDPDFLERYLGDYINGKLRYNISRKDDMPLLELNVDDDPKTYYFLLNKDKNQFDSRYYLDAPGDYGIRKMNYYNGNNGFSLRFDLKSGKLTIINQNKEYVFFKEY